MNNKLKVSVIIPAYNEERTIAKLLRNVLSVDFSRISAEKQIIVVDDYSEDKTYEIVRQNFPHIILLSNDNKKGKGHALRKGIAYSSGDILIFQDADLEYNPADYIKILIPIIRGKSEVVYGSRYLSSRWPSGMYLFNNIGNRLGTQIFNFIYGAQLTDLMTCYKAFRKEVLRDIFLSCPGFDICPEITAKIIKKKIRILEVPISYRGRKYHEGKKFVLLTPFL